MIVKLPTEHHLEFLSLKVGCRGSSESTHVKMPHCWKSHALAHLSVMLGNYLQQMTSADGIFKCIFLGALRVKIKLNFRNIALPWVEFPHPLPQPKLQLRKLHRMN